MNEEELQSLYDEVADLVRETNRILFITGAGISTDSGLPTYRGIGGLYEDRVTDDGMPIEEALSCEMMTSRPEVTWKYLWQIAEVSRNAKPNRGHEIIASWMREKTDSWIMTQNVDGLHAAVLDERIIEVHGRAANLYCIECGKEEEGHAFLFESGHVTVPEPPFCIDCKGVLRPDVVLFGEMLSDESLEKMEELNQQGVDLVMSIGTSNQFPYITAPVELASSFGIPCIEINPRETVITGLCQYKFPVACTDALREIDNRLTP